MGSNLTPRLFTFLLAGSLALCGAARAAVRVEKVCDLPAGSNSEAKLLIASDGTIFGTTRGGGEFGYGSIFKVEPGGAIQILHSFNLLDGRDPCGGLVQDESGSFYGTTAGGGLYDCGTIFTWDGTTLTTLHSFDGTDGSSPLGALTERGTGIFYGTASAGGRYRYGVLFKINTAGEFSVAWSFGPTWSFDFASSLSPSGDLLLAHDGTLYGASGEGLLNGRGSVFSISLDDRVSTVRRFFRHGGGEGTNGGLVETKDGTIYGTSRWGYTGFGALAGDIFKFEPGRKSTVIVRGFGNSSVPYDWPPYMWFRWIDHDGLAPATGMTEGIDGVLYGLTTAGGDNGLGAIFNYDPDAEKDDPGTYLVPSWAYGKLFSFDATIGGKPLASLAKAPDGSLYGTTTIGGANGGGSVFRVRGNRRPVANPDIIYTAADGSFVADVTANDSDADGDSLQVISEGYLNPYSVSRNRMVGSNENASAFCYYAVTDGYDVSVSTLEVRNLFYTYVAYFSGGSLRLQRDASGVITGTVAVGEQAQDFTGRLDSTASFTQTVGVAGVALTINAKLIDGKLVGSVRPGTRADEFQLRDTAVIPPARGTYTAILWNFGANGETQRRDGFALISVDPFGQVRLSGRLGDGTPFSAGTSSAQGTELAFSVTKKNWSLSGTVVLWPGIPEFSGGSIVYTRRGRPPTAWVMNGSLYTPPRPGKPVFDAKKIALRFSGMEFPAPFTDVLHLQPVTRHSAGPRTVVGFSRNSGLMAGKFLHQSTNTWKTFLGVVLQDQRLGGGLCPDGTGTVEMEARD